MQKVLAAKAYSGSFLAVDHPLVAIEDRPSLVADSRVGEELLAMADLIRAMVRLHDRPAGGDAAIVAATERQDELLDQPLIALSSQPSSVLISK